MKIKEIAVNTVINHPLSILNKYVWCVQEQYWSFLTKYDTKQFAKIIVRVDDSNHSMERDYELDESYKDVAIIDRYFDISACLALNKEEKKRSLLELLHNSVLYLADNYGWEKGSLVDAYNQCKRNNVEYKFKVKGKDFKSPDKEFIGSMECYWDIESFAVTGVLQARDGLVLKKQELIKVEPYNGEFIYYCNCKWDNNYTFSLYAKDKRKWSIALLSIVN